MPYTPDHPHVRACGICTCCNGPKSAGLLVCWPCYNKHNFRDGLGDRIYGAQIAAFDRRLAMLARMNEGHHVNI